MPIVNAHVFAKETTGYNLVTQPTLHPAQKPRVHVLGDVAVSLEEHPSEVARGAISTMNRLMHSNFDVTGQQVSTDMAPVNDLLAPGSSS